jgi:hypothetical protein
MQGERLRSPWPRVLGISIEVLVSENGPVRKELPSLKESPSIGREPNGREELPATNWRLPSVHDLVDAALGDPRRAGDLTLRVTGIGG